MLYEVITAKVVTGYLYLLAAFRQQHGQVASTTAQVKDFVNLRADAFINRNAPPTLIHAQGKNAVDQVVAAVYS